MSEMESKETSSHDRLLELSQVDILRLGDRRYCREKRAEAIMSAIGATRWFEKVRKGSYDPERDKILDKYPCKFIKEVRKHIPGEFFATYCKWPFSDADDDFRIQGGAFDSRDGTTLALLYHLDGVHGSLLPFSKTGHQYRRTSSSAPDRVRYITHESVHDWSIEHTGEVGIRKARVLSTSISKFQPHSDKPLEGQFWGFIRGRFGNEPPDDKETSRDEYKLKTSPIDMHEWATSRDFEVYVVAVAYQTFISNPVAEDQPSETRQGIQGVVLRGQAKTEGEDKTEDAVPHELVKIGTFLAIPEVPLNLPDAINVNWRVL